MQAKALMHTMMAMCTHEKHIRLTHVFLDASWNLTQHVWGKCKSNADLMHSIFLMTPSLGSKCLALS